jgi:hypothetical protein
MSLRAPWYATSEILSLDGRPLCLACGLCVYCRQTGNNPFHPSRGPLAAILPLFPCRFQLPIPLGENLLLMPGEHVLWRDVTDGAVQTDVVVMLYVTLNQTARVLQRQRRSGADAFPFE